MPPPWYCNRCDRAFPTEKTLDDHVKKHPDYVDPIKEEEDTK